MSVHDLIIQVNKLFESNNTKRLEEINQFLIDKLNRENVKDKSKCSSLKMTDPIRRQWDRIEHDDEISNLFIARATGDGNCLFNSGSLSLVGTEDLSQLLRICTAVELFLNPCFYAKHDCFQKSVDGGVFNNFDCAFKQSIDNKVLEMDKCNTDCVKETAVKILQLGVYVPFVCVLGLSSVLGFPIRLYTKLLNDSRLHQLYNVLIYPRDMKNNLDVCYIFWGSVSSDNNCLNHFVPLLPRSMRVCDGNEKSLHRKQETSSQKPNAGEMLISQVFSKLALKRHLSKDEINTPDTCSESKKSKVTTTTHCDFLHALNTLHQFPAKSLPSSKPSFTACVVSTSNIPSKLHLLPAPTTFNTIRSIRPCCPKTTPSIKRYFAPVANVPIKPKPNLPLIVPTSSIITNEINANSNPAAVCLPNQGCADVYDISLYVDVSMGFNEKLDVYKKIWKPSSDFIFPQNKLKNSFQHSWFEGRPWLCYSKNKDGAYCKSCVLFGKNSTKKFIGQPFVDWKNMLANLNGHIKHNRSRPSMHEVAEFNRMSLEKIYVENKSPAIHLQLDTLSKKKIDENRKKLSVIIKALLFCARQNVPLRGHRDDFKYLNELGNNPGNFQELLNLLEKSGNELLADHFKNSPRNASYRSKTIQNEILEISGNIIRDTIIAEVKKAKFYSVLCDEASDVSVKEQLSLVVRFVDENGLIREEFLGFIHCKDGTTGEQLSQLILNELERVGLNIANCVGQGYDGAGNMSGKNVGTAIRIQKVNGLALYFHCQSHKLNLCVVSACKLPSVLTMMEKVRNIYAFFEFPKRLALLLSEIDKEFCENCSRCDSCALKSTSCYCIKCKKCSNCKVGSKRLKDCCKTRWIQRIESFDVFLKLYPSILRALTSISSNVGGNWNNDSVSLASVYLGSITMFEFLITVKVVMHLMNYTKSLTTRLQSKTMDIALAFLDANCLIQLLTEKRLKWDQEFSNIFNEAVSLAELHQIDVKKPRTVSRHRENHAINNIKEFYSVSLGLQFLDVLIESLKQRFSPLHKPLFDGFYIIPSVMQLEKSWKTYFMGFWCVYRNLITCFDERIDAELDLWSHYWTSLTKDMSANEVDLKYGKIGCLLKTVDAMTFPMVYQCLKILGTVPVTTCECERSISCMRRLKTYLRSTMAQERFSSLALLAIHRDFNLDIEEIINKFAAKHPRRMNFANILDSDDT